MKKVANLKKMVEIVTGQNHLPERHESFELKSVEIAFESESLKIDIYQSNNDFYSLCIFDKELQKGVTLDFLGDSGVNVFLHYFGQKRTFAFWKKPTSKIISTTLKYVDADNENDKDIEFVWDKIPEFLFNLR